jgi:hypothetical protein
MDFAGAHFNSDIDAYVDAHFNAYSGSHNVKE